MEPDDVGLPPLVGRLLAERYLVERLIGRGGMAAVYQGRDELLARPVALKLLVGPLAHDPAASKRFRAEARAAAAVTHPNVVGVYDVGEDGDWAFIVMELVAGESLAKRLQQGPLEPAATAAVGADVLSGLEAAHRSELLHRDIKPGNVILTPDGVAKLADFGIAKAMKSASSATQPLSDPGMVLGTLSYLAPERLRGEPATVSSDLWSVGAVLYEAVTGKAPFGLNRLAGEGGAPVDVPQESVLTARPDAGPELAGVIERALAPQPEDRFASAAEMREALVGADDGASADALGLAVATAVPLDVTQAFAVPTGAGAVPAAAMGGPADPTLMIPVDDDLGPPPPPEIEREGRAWLLLPIALVVLILVGVGFLLRSSGGDAPTRPPVSSTVAHKTVDKTHRTTTTSTSTSTSTSTTTSSTTTTTSSTTTVPPTTSSTTTSTIPVTTSTTILPTTTTILPTTTTGPPPPTTTTTPPAATTTTTAG